MVEPKKMGKDRKKRLPWHPKRKSLYEQPSGGTPHAESARRKKKGPVREGISGRRGTKVGKRVEKNCGRELVWENDPSLTQTGPRLVKGGGKKD